MKPTLNDIERAEYYVKNTMTVNDIESIDTNNDDYQRFCIKISLDIQSSLSENL